MKDEQVKALVERLRRKHQVFPVQGGGSIRFGGEATHYVTDDGKRLVNPDGPAAADALQSLLSDRERLREALASAEAAIARVVEQDGGMVVATAWADDGKPSKHDRCEHGRWMYEGCDTCAEAVLWPALNRIRSALDSSVGVG